LAGDDYETTIRIVLETEGQDGVDKAADAVEGLKTQSQGATYATYGLARSSTRAASSINFLQNSFFRAAIYGSRLAGANSAITHTLNGMAIAADVLIGQYRLMQRLGVGGAGSGFAYAPGFGRFGAVGGLGRLGGLGGLGAALLPLGLMAGGAGLFALAGYNVRGGGVTNYTPEAPRRRAAHGAIIASQAQITAGEREPEAILPLRNLTRGGGENIVIEVDGEVLYNLNRRRERILRRAGAIE